MNTRGKLINVAILDLYAGEANEGMRCIHQILKEWSEKNQYTLQTKTFNVRLQQEVPSTGFDIYISSGGPGSPLESKGTHWENTYFDWISSIEIWNNHPANFPKKHVFFICHSFQLACRYFEIGNVCKRKSTAFGVFPVHMTEAGKNEPVFKGLPDPFYTVDNRDYQVIEPDLQRMNNIGARVLAIEKERPHVPLERAIMAIRFNEYFVGTQSHPEADANGMSMYLQRADKKKTVIENYGEEKWESMIHDLDDPSKIMWTYSHIIPNFLNLAVEQLVMQH